MFQIMFYVPETHLNHVKNALFAKGAGKFKNYDKCSWQILGEGEFRPLKGSKPYIGKAGMPETVSEYKVEMLCEKKHIKDVIQALLESHPYEEPAYGAFELKTIHDFMN